jgi:hypothetical protein
VFIATAGSAKAGGADWYKADGLNPVSGAGVIQKISFTAKITTKTDLLYLLRQFQVILAYLLKILYNITIKLQWVTPLMR